jgi:hypothetical protein
MDLARATSAIVLAIGLLGASCANAPNGREVLDRLEGTDLACAGEPVVREESAGCRTPAGGIVVSGHRDRAQAEEALALHLASGAEGRLVDGGGWTLLAESEGLAQRAAGHFDARVVVRLEQATDGCPAEGARLVRLREALGDPSWC